MAGVVPFARLPRKAYRPKLENVIRVDLDYLRESVAPASPSEYSDSRDDRLDLSDSDSDNSSSSSYSSYSSASSSSSPHPSSSPSSPQYQPPSYSSLKQFDELDHDQDRKSQSGNGNGSTVSHSLQKKKKFTFLKLVKGFLRQRRSYVLFQMWRERKANERRSQMLIQLEEKATVLKNKIYNEIEREIDEDQRMVEKHTKKLLKIQKTLVHREHARKQKDLKFENDKKRRQREFQKLEYNVLYMQKWSKEDHERDGRLQRERQSQLQLEMTQAEARRKEEEKKNYYLKDAQDLSADVQETQTLHRVMRQCGVKAGVNSLTHHNAPLPPLETVRFLSFKLRDDVDLNWKLKHLRTPDILMPFDVDLKLFRDVETLRGVSIGERGALALAAEFVRGACSNLNTLDLSRCQIHSRGLSRVLHGLRMGRVLNLQSLKLRGNSLTPSAMEYFRTAFQSSSFSNLKEIDLRDNELGDQGADTIAHMMIADLLQTLSILLLQRNSISDVGVTKIVKVLKAVMTQRCPQLSLISLQENCATALGKLRLKPLPFGVSI